MSKKIPRRKIVSNLKEQDAFSDDSFEKTIGILIVNYDDFFNNELKKKIKANKQNLKVLSYDNPLFKIKKYLINRKNFTTISVDGKSIIFSYDPEAYTKYTKKMFKYDFCRLIIKAWKDTGIYKRHSKLLEEDKFLQCLYRRLHKIRIKS